MPFPKENTTGAWRLATAHSVETNTHGAESEAVIISKYFEIVYRHLDSEQCRYKLRLSTPNKIRSVAMQGKTGNIFSYHALKKAVQRIIDSQKA